MDIIRLEWYEVMQAGQLALMRTVESLRRGHKHKYGQTGQNDLQNHFYGAMGEFAVAKCLDIYNCNTVNTFKAADLGSNLQVRATGCARNTKLIVRPDDCDDDYFILVDIQKADGYYNATVCGWMQGVDAKQECFLSDAGHSDRPKAYFLSEKHLSPLRELPL
jgi:hypothetical protein